MWIPVQRGRRGEFDGWGNSSSRIRRREARQQTTDGNCHLLNVDSSSCSAIKYFSIRSEFFGRFVVFSFGCWWGAQFICWLFGQPLIMINNLQKLKWFHLSGIMVSYVLLSWCQSRFDACEKDPPSCILHLPADSLCTCASNRTKDEKPDQISKPTSKREAGLGLKKYLAGHEADLLAGTGLVTAGNSSPAWTPTILFLYKWQQCIEISYTYFEAILALNKQSSIFSSRPTSFCFNR